MRISEKDRSDCIQIAFEISQIRAAMADGLSRNQRRSFTAFLMLACRDGARPSEFTMGEWFRKFRSAL